MGKIPFVFFPAGKQLGVAAPTVDPRRCDARRRFYSRVDEDHETLSPSIPFFLSPVPSISLYPARKPNPSFTVTDESSPSPATSSTDE